MTGLQMLASILMSFFIPGLGQMYQATFDTSRRDRAVYILIALGLCALFVVTWVFVPLVWIVSMIDVVIYAMGPSVPAPGARTAVAVVLAAVCLAAPAYAKDAPPLPNEALPSWNYDQATNTFTQVFPDEYGVTGIKLTWTPEGPYVPAEEPCCNCTKDSPCNHAGCKHGVRCKCCKKEASTASFEPSACKSGACGQGSRACSRHRRAAERTIGGRRLFLRRDGCRSCR